MQVEAQPGAPAFPWVTEDVPSVRAEAGCCWEPGLQTSPRPGWALAAPAFPGGEGPCALVPGSSLFGPQPGVSPSSVTLCSVLDLHSKRDESRLGGSQGAGPGMGRGGLSGKRGCAQGSGWWRVLAGQRPEGQVRTRGTLQNGGSWAGGTADSGLTGESRGPGLASCPVDRPLAPERPSLFLTERVSVPVDGRRSAEPGGQAGLI